MPELKTHLHLSTYEKMKKNPLPWILFLVFTMIFIGLIVFPKFISWQEKKTLIVHLEGYISGLTQENEEKKKEEEAKNNEFNTVAGPYLEGEKQVFPQTIDIIKVTRILELYALQLGNLDTQTKDSFFQLDKVGFGSIRKEKEKNYSQTEVTLSFETDYQNFETFIRFLQTGELATRIQNGAKRGQIQLMDYNFLQNNLLPVILIDSIKISDEQIKEKTGEIFRVQMKIILFSQ